MENVKNDVMSHNTFTFYKQLSENLGSSIYILLDKGKSPNLEKRSKAPHIRHLGSTLESMRTFYRRFYSRKEWFLRG
jgi:hypothetical protein